MLRGANIILKVGAKLVCPAHVFSAVITVKHKSPVNNVVI